MVLARTLIVLGLSMAAVGALLLVGSKLGLGRLPGDFVWQGRNVRIVVPLATSLLLSVFLTVVLNLWLRK